MSITLFFTGKFQFYRLDIFSGAFYWDTIIAILNDVGDRIMNIPDEFEVTIKECLFVVCLCLYQL